MQVFDINNSQMQTNQNLYDRLANKLDNYYFNYPQRRELNLHESHISSKFLLGIRIVAFVYLSGIYFWVLLSERSLLINIIFLTMIGYTGTWLYFGLVLQDYFLNEICKSAISPRYVQVLYEIMLCSEVPITLVFWTLLLKIILDDPNITTEDIVIQSNLHAVPLLFLIIDTVFNTFSFPLRHISALMIFNVLYLIINLAYSLAVKPIYKPISWRDFQSYVIGLGVLIITLLVFLAARFIYNRWKHAILKKRDDLTISLLSDSGRLSQIQVDTLKSDRQNSLFNQKGDL